MFKTLFQPSAVVHRTTTEMQSLHHDLPDTQMLKMEAEKIRNWQVQTEMNTKQMEKIVQNLRMTVESQRKSLLEVQLEYESVGNKMQEEINKRAFCLQKIESTRDMCSLLKTQACDLEKTLSFCDDLKDDLEFKHEEHTSLIQKLSKDFQELAKVSEEAKENYLCKMASSEKMFNEEKVSLLQDIGMQKSKVSRCLTSLEHDEVVIDILTSCLVKMKNRLEEQISCNHRLSNSNEQLLTDVKELTLNNTLLKSVVQDQKILRKRTENDLNVVDDKLQSTQIICNSLQEKINHQSHEINNKCLKIQEFNDCLRDKVAFVNQLKQQLEKKDEDLQACAKDLKFVTCTSNDLQQQVLHLLDFKENVLKELAQREIDNACSNNLLSQNKALVNQMLEEIKCAKNANEDVEKALTLSSQENKDLCSKLEEMTTESCTLKHQLESARCAIEESEKKIDFCRKDQSTLQTELNKEITKNDKLMKELESMKKLEGFPEQLRCLQTEFGSQTKRLHDSEQSVLEVAKTLQNKEKLLKECHENLKNSNAMIEEQTKSLNSSKRIYNELLIIRDDQTTELNSLYKDLQQSKDLLLEQQQKHQSALENLENDHKQQLQLLNRRLQSLSDKLEIQKEESARRKEKKSNELPIKKVKPGNFSPLYGHDVSVGGRDCSTSILPLLVENRMFSKQIPKHSSTPIQRTQKPSRVTSSSRNIRSKRNFWKRTTPRIASKTQSNPKKKNTEENWFDTDNVYGFFE